MIRLLLLLAVLAGLNTQETEANSTQKLNFFERMQAEFDKIEEAEDAEKAYQKWKKKYERKVARKEERLYRKLVFEQNYNSINNGNRKAARRLRRFRMKANKFAEMTAQEFASRYLTTRVAFNRRVTIVAPEKSANGGSGQAKLLRSEGLGGYSVNWAERGAVTGVRDQGACGSCWAMAATGAIEAHHYIKTGSLVKLSDQQLVDCSGAYGNFGCEGGWMASAFHHTIMHGLTLESNYPYIPEFQKDQACRQLNGQFRIRSYVNIGWNGDCKSLETALKRNPVTVAVEAHQWAFYEEGIMDECGIELDHGVLLVGVNTEAEEPYWLVRNGWGTDWGIEGYIKLAYGNTCGICYYPSYPLE